MALAAGQRLGSYEIQNLLGAGGMGEVYEARDTRLNRTVALKVLPTELARDPERTARFEREAQTVAAPSSMRSFTERNSIALLSNGLAPPDLPRPVGSVFIARGPRFGRAPSGIWTTCEIHTIPPSSTCWRSSLTPMPDTLSADEAKALCTGRGRQALRWSQPDGPVRIHTEALRIAVETAFHGTIERTGAHRPCLIRLVPEHQAGERAVVKQRGETVFLS
jgi:hypothetical protein